MYTYAYVCTSANSCQLTIGIDVYIWINIFIYVCEYVCIYIGAKSYLRGCLCKRTLSICVVSADVGGE